MCIHCFGSCFFGGWWGPVMRTCRAWPAWWAWNRRTLATWMTLRRRMRRMRRTGSTRRRKLLRSQVKHWRSTFLFGFVRSEIYLLKVIEVAFGHLIKIPKTPEISQTSWRISAGPRLHLGHLLCFLVSLFSPIYASLCVRVCTCACVCFSTNTKVRVCKFMSFICRVLSASGRFLLLWLSHILVTPRSPRLVLVALADWRWLGSFLTYMIHSTVMYGPRCFLLCLIQLFKAPPLHVKLHFFSPFFFMLFISFICICIERLQLRFTSTHLWIKGWAGLPKLAAVIFLPEWYLQSKPASSPSNTNTRLTNAYAVKHMFSFVFLYAVCKLWNLNKPLCVCVCLYRVVSHCSVLPLYLSIWNLKLWRHVRYFKMLF